MADTQQEPEVEETQPRQDAPVSRDVTDADVALVASLRRAAEGKAPVKPADKQDEGPKRGADGKFAAINEQPEEPDDGTEGEQQEEPPEEPEDGGNPALEQARNDIRRVMPEIKETVLSKMDEGEIMELAEAARAEKARRDREYATLMRQRESEGATDAKATQTENQEAPPDGQPSLDLGEMVKPFKDEWGDEAASAYEQSLKPLVDTVQQLQQALQAERQERHTEKLQAAETAARQRLGERFPEVVDEAWFAEHAAPRADKLAKTGDYPPTPEGVTALLTDAVEWAISKGAPRAQAKQAEPKSRESNADKRGGQAPGQGKSPARALSKSEIEVGIVAAARRGRDSDVARLSKQLRA